MQILRRRAQNTAEYAILISIVIAAMFTIQTYVRRGVQGRFKAEVDELEIQTTELNPSTDFSRDYGQFEPDYLSSERHLTTMKDKTTEVFGEAAPGSVNRTSIVRDKSEVKQELQKNW